ncbi:MAG: GntR family transcriptional regulator [Thermoleophilia bacterium]|nr:GntR family transcriptional regulator [Thermoleophilia bacterium]
MLETLRKAILSGELESGTPLVQAELSEQLGVSKTPIREAIRDLAAEGLIDFDSYRSSIVHTPTLVEAREIYELRLALEPLAITRSVGAIAEVDLERAESLLAEMERVEDAGDWIRMNWQFHALLDDRKSASRLNGIIVQLRNASAIQVAWSLQARPSLIKRADRDHAEILGAYRRGDVDAAIRYSRHHLETTLKAIESQAGKD